MLFFLSLLLIVAISVNVDGLNNGLALRPPMGWLSWGRYTCNIDCDQYPNSCINENLYKNAANRLIELGFVELGYNIVGIDDCWSEKERDPKTNQLIPDRKRFPSGIKALADYMHKRGLKLGIYGDVGPTTCARYPGQNGPGKGYFDIDAQTFADWEVDLFKFDGCFEDPAKFDDLYPQMLFAINKTGRPIIYLCEWPLYQTNIGMIPNYEKISEHCNMYRNHDDVEDRWTSIISIIDDYAANQETYSKYNGPGRWNDPDMLLIGNNGLSHSQSETQMAMWAMWSAPLIMSNDLNNLDEKAIKILQNRRVIAVNQDPLGKFGKRILQVNQKDKYKHFEIWVKELYPVNGQESWAIVYLNRYPLGNFLKISASLRQLINCTNGDYLVEDLFDENNGLTVLDCNQELALMVQPSGSVRMVRLTKFEEKHILIKTS